jgi:hypothetical protein
MDTERPTIDVNVATPIPIKSRNANPSLFLKYQRLQSEDGDWGFKVLSTIVTPYPFRLGWPTDAHFDDRLNDWKIEELYALEKRVGETHYSTLKNALLDKFIAINRFVATYRAKKS